MFVGHLAVALASKRAEPRLPLVTLVAATYALDLIWPLLLLAGAERVVVDPDATRFTPLAFVHYPWSHSLLMALVWGALAALIVMRKRIGRAALVAGAVVVSHWVLDYVTHRPDLPLWPGGPDVGLGLWYSVAGTIALEGAIFAAAILLYARRFPARRTAGHWAFWSLIAFTTAIWLAGPWAPPPPDAGAVMVVGLALWIFLPWAAWIDRHRG